MLFGIDEAAILKHGNSAPYVTTDVRWSTLPLNIYHSLLRLILISCQKRVVNSLFETASELKTNIDPEFTV